MADNEQSLRAAADKLVEEVVFMRVQCARVRRRGRRGVGSRAELAPGARGEAEALREVVCLLGDELARARAEHEELRGRGEDPGTASDDRLLKHGREERGADTT